ncbi:MAG: hypothetical protein KatS3mg108_2756 [Isosphaeraceae bacterium]|jgi:PII-like signaling protein|nr:MAG: hypothetical protein KatS3mg108_2756 [Isosphaeraceae bacterium]
MTPNSACLVRLYLNANDQADHRPLFETLVLKARELGLAGASVFPAELGFGCHRVIHDTLSEYSFSESPLIIEVVDQPPRIDAWLAECSKLLPGGLATIRTVNPVLILHHPAPHLPGATPHAD